MAYCCSKDRQPGKNLPEKMIAEQGNLWSQKHPAVLNFGELE
jgi:hypothetical protein